MLLMLESAKLYKNKPINPLVVPMQFPRLSYPHPNETKPM